MNPLILVTDDDEAMRLVLRGYLEERGYEVMEASNGLEALKAIARRKPDLVILDVLMAPLSGWDVLRMLQENPETADIRVLLLTALGDTTHEACGWHLGCDWYQVKSKPLQLDDLGLVVQRLLALDPREKRAALLAGNRKTGEKG